MYDVVKDLHAKGFKIVVFRRVHRTERAPRFGSAERCAARTLTDTSRGAGPRSNQKGVGKQVTGKASRTVRQRAENLIAAVRPVAAGAPAPQLTSSFSRLIGKRMQPC